MFWRFFIILHFFISGTFGGQVLFVVPEGTLQDITASGYHRDQVLTQPPVYGTLPPPKTKTPESGLESAVTNGPFGLALICLGCMKD